MIVSVVIPTYRRPEVVIQAMRSVVDTFKDCAAEVEIIVVDDCSRDGTRQSVENFRAGSFAIHYLENDVNRGVTGSKNAGFLAASGQWVMFLDSDDRLVSEMGTSILDVLRAHGETPIVFFRCQDDQGKFVGTEFQVEQTLDLKMYLRHTSYGEALIAINRSIVSAEPFVERLRGYEGLGCCRIIKTHGAAVLSTVVARIYDRRGEDRLSATSGFLKRLPLLAEGHRLLVREFRQSMSLGQALKYQLKAVGYSLVGSMQRWFAGRAANARSI